MESDPENVDVNDYEEDETVQAPQKEKVDKRKISSKLNMAKARLKKLELLKHEKQAKERTYNIYEDSESESESSDEELVIKKKYKKHAPTKRSGKEFPNQGQSEINELKDMMKMMIASQLKAKKKKPTVKKQINLQLPDYTKPASAQPKEVNQKMLSLAQRLINI